MPSTGVTLVTICNFIFLDIISFVVVVVSSFNRSLRNAVFSDLLIVSEQENNLQGNKITNSGQS